MGQIKRMSIMNQQIHTVIKSRNVALRPVLLV